MSTIDRRQFLQRMVIFGGGALATAALLSLLDWSKVDSPQLPGDDAMPTDNATPTDNTTPPDGRTPIDNATPPHNTTPPDDTTSPAYLAVAHGSSPTTLVEKAIDALGGIGRFVKSGDDVIIKPNICTAYHAPEFAATTNPEVVAALVALCLGAGAGRVRVMDRTFDGTAEEAYANSGIAEAVKAAGGEMELMATMKFQDTPILNGHSITSCRVYQDILETDVLIDVPIAKQHGMSEAVLSLGMKNMLGVVSNPGNYHTDMAERVTDLNTLVRPHLVVLDAIRILMDHGPTGGNLNDVKRMNTIIASHDIVAADSYGATLFGKTADDLPIVRAGAKRGLGTMDLTSIKIEEIVV